MFGQISVRLRRAHDPSGRSITDRKRVLDVAYAWATVLGPRFEVLKPGQRSVVDVVLDPVARQSFSAGVST